MEMEEDVDDPMEIDDTLQESRIIERKSDEFVSPVDSGIASSASTEDTSVVNEPTSTNTASVQNNETSLIEDPASTNKSSSSVPDIVILDDDDDEPEKETACKSESNAVEKMETPVEDIIDLVEKPTNVRCLNTACCGTNTDFLLAADFCLAYYRVKRSKSYKEEICISCYKKAIEDFDNLSTHLRAGKIILECNYPVINETVQIEDSSDSDSELDVDYLDKENFQYIKENIDDIIQKALVEFKVEEQYKLETEFLKKETEKFEGQSLEISKKVSEIRNVFDRIQIDLYNQFRPDFRNLKGLSITDDSSVSPNLLIKTEIPLDANPRKSTRSHKPVSYVELDDMGSSNSPKVVAAVAPEVEPPKDLPQVVPITRPPPQVGEIYYIVRENSQSNWIRGRLQAIVDEENPYHGQSFTLRYYKLIELKQQKERHVTGRQMAYLNPSKVRLPVGTRVISVFKETCLTGQMKKPRLDPYYAGVVAEQPFEGNKYRYLIFFDIGYSQYVSYNCVNLVLEASADVWEDIFIDSRPFIKKYLESQDRPMVKLSKDQTVRVEYNGKWWLCTVVAVDCSLVQVYFEILKRTEWIYRGSTRLSPMFREEQAATNRGSGVRTSRKLGPNESQTVVQYTRKDDLGQGNENQNANQESPTNVRAVARKSTTRPQGTGQIEGAVPFLPEVKDTSQNVTGPTSKIMYFTPRDQVIIKREYKNHDCCIRCKEYLTHNFSQLRGHNPLSKPLLCGWGRMTHKAKGRKEIIYKAPCARVLRNIAEVHVYLRLTKSEMTVDLFDFNHMVRCLAEFNVDCTPDPKDLSRGLEQTPVPVINGINNEMLDFCNYSIKRVPMGDVRVNVDPDFLCGCDCDDDCIDKTKCACWKLTMEGAKYIGKDNDPNSVGYIYRRLPEQVITGIYECNSKCKCNQTCLNRVVQNPMSLKLQVFRTHNRGWGIRCLNDVPQGSFICIYAGTIHTEAKANVDGIAYGDEYFAELDYIETVEKYKEDYEAEVQEDEEEETYTKRKSPVEEEDEEDSMLRKITSNNSKYKRYNYSEDNDFVPFHPDRVAKGDGGIRTRLRRRYQDEDGKSDPDEKVNKKPETKQERDIKIKKEMVESRLELKAVLEGLSSNIETVTISDEEDEGREVLSFNPKASGLDEKATNYISVRELFGGKDECVYVMDAKNAGNIGRFLNHSCSPNVFVQNVFVDTHDPRFPWVSFFSSQFIRAGTELTWNYNYDIGSVPGRVLYCHCSSLECKGRLL